MTSLRVSILMRKLGFDSNHSKLIKAGIEKVTDAELCRAADETRHSGSGARACNLLSPAPSSPESHLRSPDTCHRAPDTESGHWSPSYVQSMTMIRLCDIITDNMFISTPCFVCFHRHVCSMSLFEKGKIPDSIVQDLKSVPVSQHPCD